MFEGDTLEDLRMEKLKLDALQAEHDNDNIEEEE